MTLLQTDRQTDTRLESLANRLGQIISAVHVKTYTRTVGGKLETVHEHEDKRKKQEKPQAIQKRLSREEIKEKVQSAIETAKEKVGSAIQKPADEKPKNQTDTPEFKSWFGDSKVVDKDGKPLVMYHGTTKDFTEFKNYEEYGGGHGEIHFFTTNKDYANVYTEDKGSKEGGNIIPVYLRSEKLFDTTNPAHMALVKKAFKANGMEPWEKKAYIEDYFHKGLPIWDNGDMIRMAQKNGFDGIKMVERKSGIESIGVFSPTQIKSAIGNKGTWSKTDPNIAASDHSVDITEMVQAIRRERLARRIYEIVKCANSDTTPFTAAQTKAKNERARQLAQTVYEAAAIAAAHKIEADKKEKRKKEIAAILLILLLAGEDAYQKVYSTLGRVVQKENGEGPGTPSKEDGETEMSGSRLTAQIKEQAKTFAASRQEDLQEFAGKLRDAITDAKAEAFEMPETDAARHVREAAVKTSQVMIDVESTITLGSIELDRLKRAGFKTVFWDQLDRPTKRHSHALNMELGVVPLGTMFPSGQQYPGDPRAGVGETANCLCILRGVERE